MHYSICPVVRDQVMQLFQQAEIGGTWRMLSFEQRILWVREASAEVVLRHDGLEIKRLVTLCDFHGYLTSLEAAIQQDAREWVGRFKVGVGDRLSVDVDLAIRDLPLMEDTSDEAKRDAQRYAGRAYRKSYVIPRPEGGYWLTAAAPDADGVLPRLEPVRYLERKMLYSSARDGECTAVPRQIAEFIERERREANQCQKAS